jgi:hypothetical protein
MAVKSRFFVMNFELSLPIFLPLSNSLGEEGNEQ